MSLESLEFLARFVCILTVPFYHCHAQHALGFLDCCLNVLVEMCFHTVQIVAGTVYGLHRKRQPSVKFGAGCPRPPSGAESNHSRQRSPRGSSLVTSFRRGLAPVSGKHDWFNW